MNTETLKKAVELNKEFEKISILVNGMAMSQDEEWSFVIKDRELGDSVFKITQKSRLRTAFKKAANEVFTEIKKEIEAL